MFRFCPDQGENEGDCKPKIMNQDLERYLQNFIESKDTFEFADLALHHYLAFNGQDQKQSNC